MITDIDLIAEQCLKDSKDWFPDLADNTFFMAAAAAGEAGECVNKLKKVERGTHTPDEVAYDAAAEAMDNIIYALHVIALTGYTPSALYNDIREKNAQRFGVPAATCPGGC